MNHGHGKSKSLIHVFSVARQEADLLVPLEPYKFPIKGQMFKEIIKNNYGFVSIVIQKYGF